MQHCKNYLKILKAFSIAKNLKYVGYQHGFASMVYKFFDEKSTVANNSDVAIKSELILNQRLAKQLHKPILGNLKLVKYTLLS